TLRLRVDCRADCSAGRLESCCGNRRFKLSVIRSAISCAAWPGSAGFFLTKALANSVDLHKKNTKIVARKIMKHRTDICLQKLLSIGSQSGHYRCVRRELRQRRDN